VGKNTKQTKKNKVILIKNILKGLLKTTEKRILFKKNIYNTLNIIKVGKCLHQQEHPDKKKLQKFQIIQNQRGFNEIERQKCHGKYKKFRKKVGCDGSRQIPLDKSSKLNFYHGDTVEKDS